MELIPLSTEQLKALAERDDYLSDKFLGVFAADRVPRQAITNKGFIINTDPHNKPGQHWLGAWVKGNACKVFDSYGLPLSVYSNPHLQQWLKSFKYITSNGQTLQALDSMACGHYALEYLKQKARGVQLSDFLQPRHKRDFVLNDNRIAEMVENAVVADLKTSQKTQSCVKCRDAHVANCV